MGDASELDFERVPGQVIIRLGLSGGRTSIPELADFGVASGHVALKLLTGGAVKALRVELARLPPRASVSDVVRARLRAQCENAGPSLSKVAAELRMSERTLHRRLHGAGTHFRSLLDEVRRERAQYLLSHTEYSISDIAQRLGFSDATAFGRAFRRWFGLRPSQYRAQL